MSGYHRSLPPPVSRLLLALLMAVALLTGCAGPTPAPLANIQPTNPPPTAAPKAAPPTEAPKAEPTQPPAPAPTDTAAAPTAAPQAEPTLADKDYSPDIKDPTQPVTITFASWVHGQGENDIWKELADRFHKIHPNITIEFQDIPFEEIHDKLVTQIAANNPPDTAYIDSGMVGEFASRDSLVSLDNFITLSQVIDLKDYVPAFLLSTKFEGKTYGLPTGRIDRAVLPHRPFPGSRPGSRPPTGHLG